MEELVALSKRMAFIEQRHAQNVLANRKMQDKLLNAVTFVGVDSTSGVNGRPAGVFRNRKGGLVKAAVIASGMRSGDKGVLARSGSSTYGFVSGMPAGRY